MKRHPLIRMILPVCIFSLIYATGTSITPESWHACIAGLIMGALIMWPIHPWIYKYGINGKG